jgi:hypothetical protein
VPGRNPYEAFQDFIDPLQMALSCLGVTKIQVSSGGKQDIDTDHSWLLSDGGMALGDGLFFRAAMRYQIIEDAQYGYRITTRSYMYSLLRNGEEVWSMHWHPDGNSDYSEPHFHIPSVAGKGHLPASRMTFEEAILWTIRSGAAPAREDWESVLTESYERHVKHRSWDTHTGTIPVQTKPAAQ